MHALPIIKALNDKAAAKTDQTESLEVWRYAFRGLGWSEYVATCVMEYNGFEVIKAHADDLGNCTVTFYGLPQSLDATLSMFASLDMLDRIEVIS